MPTIIKVQRTDQDDSRKVGAGYAYAFLNDRAELQHGVSLAKKRSKFDEDSGCLRLPGK